MGQMMFDINAVASWTCSYISLYIQYTGLQEIIPDREHFLCRPQRFPTPVLFTFNQFCGVTCTASAAVGANMLWCAICLMRVEGFAFKTKYLWFWRGNNRAHVGRRIRTSFWEYCTVGYGLKSFGPTTGIWISETVFFLGRRQIQISFKFQYSMIANFNPWHGISVT